MVYNGPAAVHLQLFLQFLKNYQSFEMIIVTVTPDYNAI